MIDASRSPRPQWQRIGMLIALVALVAIAAFVIWTKELHHSSSPSTAASKPSTALPVPARPATSKPTPTTIPGGIPMSSRNPFG